MKIKRHHHYGTPFPFPHFTFFKHHHDISCNVSFDDTVRYNIGSDQSDINKLTGISYGMHHRDSDRIGWRYLIDRDMVEIVGYSYENGTRVAATHLWYAHIGEELTVSISSDYKDNKRTVWYTCNTNTVSKTYDTHSHFFNYTLGLYFGGDCTAPHDINVNVK